MRPALRMIRSFVRFAILLYLCFPLFLLFPGYLRLIKRMRRGLAGVWARPAASLRIRASSAWRSMCSWRSRSSISVWYHTAISSVLPP